MHSLLKQFLVSGRASYVASVSSVFVLTCIYRERSEDNKSNHKLLYVIKTLKQDKNLYWFIYFLFIKRVLAKNCIFLEERIQ